MPPTPRRSAPGGGPGDSGGDVGSEPEGSTGPETSAEAGLPEATVEAGPEAATAPDAGGDACTTSWTCLGAAVVGPGHYCVVDAGAPSILATPPACTGCGQYTCACVVEQASIVNPCGVHSLSCSEASGGPAILCN